MGIRRIGNTACAVFICFFILSTASGCSRNNTAAEGPRTAVSPFATFRDVPGINEDEINAIEELQRLHTSFEYGMILTTEAFFGLTGEVSGYSALFCEWLTELFGITFIPRILSPIELFPGLINRNLDFSGNIMPTPERMRQYFMTDPIAERQFVTVRLKGSRSFNEILLERPLRYIFIENTPMIEFVSAAAEYGSFEPLFALNDAQAYLMLQRGQGDAYITTSIAEVFFIEHDDILVEDFFPLLFNPVSMATANPALEPIISVVRKAQNNGIMPYLNYLYHLGLQDFRKFAMYTLLTDDERAFIERNPTIPIAAFNASYPLSYWDIRDGKWDGIFFDIMDEVSALTGLAFDVVHDESTDRSVANQMLATGAVSLIPGVIWSRELDERFLWSNHILLDDHYALISKADFPHITLNEIIHVSIGVARNSPHATMFAKWFPNHTNVIEFDGINLAFDALTNGNVDMVMSEQRRVLQLTHLQEQPDYKVNMIFNEPLDMRVTFARDAETLRSIVDKALGMTDIDGTVLRWTQRTYDYRAKVLEAQMPWLIGAVLLAFALLALTLVFFIRISIVSREMDIQRKEAEIANRAKSEFLSHISHEIRTPMNAILGAAEIQLQKGIHTTETEEAFNTIYGSGNLLLNIINDILDLSKIEARKLEIIPNPYDIPSLIYDTMQLNLLRYDSKPIDFDLKIGKNTPLDMYGDELRIKQIMNNMISNAFKYTDTGKIELSVSVETDGAPTGLTPDSHTACTLILRISDTGQGMTEEQIDKLFDEYTRFNLDSNRTIVGTGLGMHITKRLIDAMNGEIAVESTLGQGSEFIVHLPQEFIGTALCENNLAEKLISSRFKSTLKLKKSQFIYEYMPYGKVLVVDDVESNLYVAKGLLFPYGLKIETAASGFEAIEKIEGGQSYDVIFMDHMMPKMNGLEATQIIRKMGYAKPIVALTANAVMGSSEMFLSGGFDGYISKPIDIRELNNSLNRLIRDKQPPEVIEAVQREMETRKQAPLSNPVQNSLLADKIAMASKRDIENAIAVLKNISHEISGVSDINLFTTTVHGMKSALANINETELSNTALRLERLGLADDLVAIQAETPAFVNALESLVKKATPDEATAPEEATPDELALLHAKLTEVKTACEKINKKAAKAAMDELLVKKWPKTVSILLDDLSEYLLVGEFKKAVTAIEDYF